MMPTPAVDNANEWGVTKSVNLEEAARATEALIQGGIGSIALNGTTGECAALLWDEKVEFVDTVVQVNNGRVPLFAGATSLGTKETIRQMRALLDVGAQGAFVGLPLWQTPTLETSIRWFEDLSEAVPGMGIMVYSNSMFFKSVFPRAFWEGVAKRAPTVITNKIASPAIMEDLEEIVRLTGDKITYLPIDHVAVDAAEAFKKAGNHIQGVWSTGSSMGPEPVVALMDALLADDYGRVEEVMADLHSVPAPVNPPSRIREILPEFNAQFENARFAAAGFIKVGPNRPPYTEPLPADVLESSIVHGKAWAEMRKKYIKTAV